METLSQTVTLTEEQQDEFFRYEVKKEAERVFSSSSPFWKGVEQALKWFREKVREALKLRLPSHEFLLQWEGRIAGAIVLDSTTIISTTINFLRLAISSPRIWELAHKGSIREWENNKYNGLLAQSWAYGKKMAAYFWEIIKECLGKAMEVHGCKLSQDEKQQLASALEDVLPK